MDRKMWECEVEKQPDRARVWWKRHFAVVKALGWTERRALRPYLGVLIQEDQKEIDIADIGCGAYSIIGDIWPETKVNLYASDLLAEKYSSILEELGIAPVTPVEVQDMENLTYPDNRFDIVHCSNALDHCFDPKKAIKEMVRVCKPGGYVYFHHFINVGEKERYHGLHQWNIHHTKDGDCLFWEKIRGDDFLLSNIVSGFMNKVAIDCGRRYLDSILRKS